MNNDKSDAINGLLRENRFEDFCNLYRSLEVCETYVDFKDLDQKAVPFAWFVLEAQKAEFNVEIIEYLLMQGCDVKPFLNSIAGEPCHTDQNPIEGLLSYIVKHQDIRLLDYFHKTDIACLKSFSNKSLIIKYFLDIEWKEGLDYYQDEPDNNLYILEEIERKLRGENSGRAMDWSRIAYLLNIKNIAHLKNLLTQHIEKTDALWSLCWKGLKDSMGSFMRSNQSMLAVVPRQSTGVMSGSSIMPSRYGLKSIYYKNSGNKNSHKKIQNLCLDFADTADKKEFSEDLKALWRSYLLEISLEEKPQSRQIKL